MPSFTILESNRLIEMDSYRTEKEGRHLTQNEVIRNLFVGDDAYNVGEFAFVVDLRAWNAERTFLEKDYQVITGMTYSISQFHRSHDGGKVLVHCHAGMDRSPFIVAMYLHEYKDMKSMEAYELVKKRRPQTIIHDEWVRKYLQISLPKGK